MRLDILLGCGTERERFTFNAFVLAVSTQFEAAWIGSPIRRWTRYAIPVTVAVFVVAGDQG